MGIICILMIMINLMGADNMTIQKSADKMAWFKQAKLGIFIHWGIYSVNGIDESWSFYNNYLPYDAYMAQANGFSDVNYDPIFWAKLIKDTQAGYAVLTAKHHDGVTLWPTKFSDLNLQEQSGIKQDLLLSYCEALRKADLKVGIYYSLIDWSHPDYPNFTITEKRYTEDEQRWERFRKFMMGQLSEISTQYNPDLIWFDGDWEHSAEKWQAKEIRKTLLTHNPQLIINSRLQGYGDYSTPEQGVPIQQPDDDFWELCLTMNDSWGYQPHDTNYKSANQILRIFADCVSKGGNLLLDIAPKADGSIPEKQVKILEELARWNKKYHEAIFPTTSGIKLGHFHGATTLSIDKKDLYLFIENEPNAPILVKGINNRIKQITELASGEILPFEKAEDDLWIKLEKQYLDEQITVIKIEMDEPIDLIEVPNRVTLDIPKNFSNAELDTMVLLSYIDLKVYENTMDRPRHHSDNINNWKNKHFEAMSKSSKSKPGLPDGLYNGYSSLNEGEDILFLYVMGKPKGPIAISGVKNEINRIRIVGDGTKLEHKICNKLYWNEKPGIIYIDVPEDRLDANITVIAVQLKGKLELYAD